MKEYNPVCKGSVTKYVFVESPSFTPSDLAIKAYEVSQGVMIKETCFGLQITGNENEIETIVELLRKLDPLHICVKDRGFPPGDNRRCRSNLGGARPGYFGHEFEMGLLHFISYGLKSLDSSSTPDNEPLQRKMIEKIPLPLEKLRQIIDSEVN